MSKKLYVGGLPFSVTEADLGEMFAPMGEIVSVKLILDKYTGRSRGFGFVEMANDAEAVAAVEKMNGSDCEGRTLTVNEARPMEPRQRNDGPRRDFGRGRDY